MIKKSLVALALGTFALGISQFTMLAILDDVAHALSVSIPAAGWFISAYSLGVAVGAPFLLFLNRFSLKYVLLALTLLIVIGNAASSCAYSYATLLGARFLSGLPHGAYFGVAAVMATTLASEKEKAASVAVMVSGMTFANIFGVPLATFLADALSWRVAFIMASLAGALAFLGIHFSITRKPPLGEAGSKGLTSQFAFLKTLAPWLILLGAFLGQSGIFCWFSYVEPALLHVSGFSRHSIALIMMVAGVGMFLGGIAAAKLADRFKAGLVTGMICGGMAPLLFLVWYGSQNQILALVLVFFGASCIFGFLSPMQYLIVRFSSGGKLFGSACLQITLNVASAVAAATGGFFIHSGFGYTSPALAGIPLAIAGSIVLLYFNHKYAAQE